MFADRALDEANKVGTTMYVFRCLLQSRKKPLDFIISVRPSAIIDESVCFPLLEYL